MRRDVVLAALLLRFLLELGLIAAAAVWGWRTSGPLLGVGAALAVAALWGLLLSPRAPVRLPWPLRAAVETLVWLAAALALARVGLGQVAAVGLGVLAVDSAVLVASGEWRRPGSSLAALPRATRR